jgi:hypothetical protein
MTAGLYLRLKTFMAFSSKVDAGSRRKRVKNKAGALVLIQSD